MVRISGKSCHRCHPVVPQGCENSVHPTMDGELVRRVTANAMLLYLWDVRTLAS
jgi:hypothetical protein